MRTEVIAMNRTKLFLLKTMSCLIALPSLPALAESVLPPNRGIDVAPVSTLTSKPVTKLMMGNLKVVFEKSTLSQILNEIGIGRIEHQGDASESISWICYTIPNKPLSQRVWISAGEMGGSEHRVDGVQALQSEAIKSSEGCPTLPQRFFPIQFDKGLWLNKSPAGLKKVLGKPSVNKQSWWSYSYAGKKSGLYDGKLVDYDVMSLFEAQVKGGVITSINATQVTSY